MCLKYLFISRAVLLCIIVALIIPSESFHVATKIRHKHICGKKLLDKVFSQCEESVVSASVSKKQLSEKYSFSASNSNSDDNPDRYFEHDSSFCCHGVACNNDVISKYCDFW